MAGLFFLPLSFLATLLAASISGALAQPVPSPSQVMPPVIVPEPPDTRITVSEPRRRVDTSTPRPRKVRKPKVRTRR